MDERSSSHPADHVIADPMKTQAPNVRQRLVRRDNTAIRLAVWSTALCAALLSSACSQTTALTLNPQTLTDTRLPESPTEPAPASAEEARLVDTSKPDIVNPAEISQTAPDSTPASRPQASQAPTEEPPQLSEEAEDPATARSKRFTTVIVANTPQESQTSSERLVAASRAEQVRREQSPTPVAVITNDNLAESAEGGQLTIAPVVAERPESAQPIPPAADEEYWRQGVLERRLAWRDAVADVERLEAEVSGFRRSFYAEDDPFYRDSEIKPSWDRSLENLALARERVMTSEAELTAFLEFGRTSGALPGWLREGLDLEPDKQESLAAERRRAGDQREPRVVDEDDWENEP